MILGAVALDARLAYAFGAGMVAAINPCGFAMLPAYLSYFVGAEENRGDTGGRPLARAAGVTAVMTLGFIVVFALAGSVLSQLYQRLAGQTGWATLVIGLLLVGFGIALIAGKELVVQLPKLSRGGSTRGLGSMFLFGVSYAIASLSCTITVFIATIASTFNQRGVLAGFAVFVAYGLGMGTLIGILTAAVAMAQKQLVARFRQSVRYVARLSGGFMLIAGLYLAYYGLYELRGPSSDPIIDRAFSLQTRLSEILDVIGTGRLAAVALVGLVFAIVAGVLKRHRRLALDNLDSEPPALARKE